jgi:transposase-like protein
MHMGNLRRKHAPALKAKVALAAVKETKTIPALASEYEVHPTQVKQWKEKLEHDAGQIFTDPNRHKDEDKDKLIQDLYKQVGKLSVQNDWLKKKLGLTDD